jgi:hypothetical protein
VALHELINNRIENRDYERKTFGFAEEETPKVEEDKKAEGAEKKEEAKK